MSINKIEIGSVLSKIKVDETSNVGKAESVEKSASLKETKLTKVEFSESAKIFMQAIHAIKGAPDVRMERVAELKAAISSGTYKVDATKLAAKMLKAHLLDQ